MATYEEFTIDQGADVAIQIELVDENDNPKDLSNHTVTAFMKKNYTSSTFTQFSTIVADPPTDGIITMALTSTQTNALKAGRYVYDVEISFVDQNGNTIVERVLEGRVQLTPSVTVSGGS